MPISDWTFSSVKFDESEDVITRGKKVISLLTSSLLLPGASYEEAASGNTLYKGWYRFSDLPLQGICVTIEKDGTGSQTKMTFCTAHKIASDGTWVKDGYGSVLFDGIYLSGSTAGGAGLLSKDFNGSCHFTVYIGQKFMDTNISESAPFWMFSSKDYFDDSSSASGFFDGTYVRMSDTKTYITYNTKPHVCGGTNFPDNFYLVAAPVVVSNNFFYGFIGEANSLYYINVKSSPGKLIKLGTKVFECVGDYMYYAVNE